MIELLYGILIGVAASLVVLVATAMRLKARVRNLSTAARRGPNSIVNHSENIVVVVNQEES